jgi:hypothetical protein
MSRLPPPPPPVGHGPGEGHAPPSFAPGTAPPSFAPAGYPPPGPASAPPTNASLLGVAPPAFAPKLRVRKTPEMLGFRSVDTLGTIVTALLAVWVPFSIYVAKLSIDYQNLVDQYGLKIPFDQEHPIDTRLTMLHRLDVALLVVTVPLFLMWFARAYGNLPTISPGNTKSRTSTATIMWFVPIASLIRPMGYMKELWTRTDRASFGKAKPPVIIVVYWLTFLVTYVLSVASVGVGMRDTLTVEDAKLAANLDVLASASAVVSAALIASIVWMVTRRMTRRCAEVTNAVLSAPQH